MNIVIDPGHGYGNVPDRFGRVMVILLNKRLFWPFQKTRNGTVQ